MTRYRFDIHARLKGAIGLCYDHVVETEGETVDEAKLKLYDTHEHITIWSYSVVPAEQEQA